MSWITTYTGKRFYPLDPKEEDVDIVDIAHALSLVCRFGGHCLKFYSVAQHSVLVSQYVLDESLKLTALLHDAAEAYTADICRPIKHHFKEFKEVEDRLERVIMKKYGGIFPMPEGVRVVDDSLLLTEARDLKQCGGKGWSIPRVIYPFSIKPWTWQKAERKFLDRFDELTRKEGT